MSHVRVMPLVIRHTCHKIGEIETEVNILSPKILHFSRECPTPIVSFMTSVTVTVTVQAMMYLTEIVSVIVSVMMMTVTVSTITMHP